MTSKLTRKACRNREMIGGIDAQSLEHALAQVEQEVTTLTTRLAAVEKDRDDWKRSSELVARVLIDTKDDLTAAMKVVEAARDTLKGTESMATSATCQHCTKMMVKMLKLFEALAAMKDKPKGRFLPNIEDLSHTIDFDKPKCGTCGGTHCVDTPFSGSDPSCPECDQGKE